MGGGFSQFAIAATAFEIVESLANRGVVEQLGQLLINRIDGLGLHDCHTRIVQPLPTPRRLDRGPLSSCPGYQHLTFGDADDELMRVLLGDSRVGSPTVAVSRWRCAVGLLRAPVLAGERRAAHEYARWTAHRRHPLPHRQSARGRPPS